MKNGRSAPPGPFDDPGFRAAIGALTCDLLEERNPWLLTLPAVGCSTGAVYLFIQRIWIPALIVAVWSIVAFRRWWWPNINTKQRSMTNSRKREG